MPRRRPARFALVALLALAVGSGERPAAAQRTSAQAPPAPTRWVTDGAGFLSPAARAALDAKLRAYEQRSGHQVIVWIDRTLDGRPLDDFAVRTFAAWQLGRKGHDDGLALFIFADDRKVAIEVGYGLEDRVPDARAAGIIRDTLAPLLREGQNDRAVAAAVNELLTLIEGRPAAELGLPETPETTATPPPQARAPDEGPALPELILYAILGFFMLVLLVKNPHLAAVLLSGLFRGGGGGGWGGGWGGGGGGFSGGGGRSGGGGARGGW